MLIKTLVENTALGGNYEFQHGLSFYVETGDHKILVDLGQNDMFYRNAQRLGVDIADVDTVFITHGHYDHGGGLETFLKYNGKAKVYIHKLAFESYYSLDTGKLKYIGLDRKLKTHPQICFISGDTHIDDSLDVMTFVTDRNFNASCNNFLRVKRNDAFENDVFMHEQYLIITEGDRHYLFSGCAHTGIVNILEQAEKQIGGQITAVFSGFHLFNPGSGKLADLELIEALGDRLKQRKTIYYTGHCTGQVPFELLKDKLGDQIQYISAGTTLTFQ